LKEGLVEIQDAGSQMIAPQLDPKAGEFIIDTCAGAGGKTLHLAALIQNQGRILATDVSKRKLQELERRAKRAEATCIETRLIDAEMVAQFEGQADKLLIDAPCSGLGTLKRQPDLKWRLSQEQLTEVQQTQAELLQSYTRMLKPGGRLVYATCSVLPSENQMQVAPLIQSGDYTLHAEQILSPAKFHFDGFYTAALIKRPQ
ncbi:MAG: RsmB/NOP family class I SAM-dependent RNA methyltransferase, partial [Verrucomicrobiota bacterium]